MTASERPARPSFHKKKRPVGVNAIVVLSSLSLIYAITMLVALYVDAASVVPALAPLQLEQWLVVYLSGRSGELVPRWVACASHDYEGDDLRRRWDDPDLHLVEGTHPVVYAGAGSHASYFLPGEYLMSVEPAPLYPIQRGLNWVFNFWTNNLGQGAGDSGDTEPATYSLASIPVVDYARGDGVCIGPGQREAWTPVMIFDELPWVDRYRGLWGSGHV